MQVSIIAAMSLNRAIGYHNSLPWHLPADMAHFKQKTMGKPVIMGRVTHESIGRALPGRTNIVLSRGELSAPAEGVIHVTSLNAALSVAEQHLDASEETMIMGGADIYYQYLPRADRMYLTLVETEVEGDAHFPAYNPEEWEVIEAVRHEADQHNEFPYQLLTYQRIRS